MPTPSPLIDVETLHAQLGDPALVLLDATAALPGEAFDADGFFADAHLPGARRFDGELFSDPDTDLPHTVPSPGRFARLAGALGVGDASDIVVYDGRAPFSAPRAWWLFRLHGHARVRVLDGGLPAWLARGLPVERGEAAVPVPGRFTACLRTSLLAGLADVEHGLAAGDFLLLDARAAGRFAGTAPEPRPGIRSGHIPGSVNLPFGRLYEPDGRLRPPAALRAEFAAAGVDGFLPVTVSCGTGVTAAVLALGLAVAGFPDAALFDGSWCEWASVHR